MKDKGFIKTYRVTFATELWNEPRTFSRYEAWQDILRRTWYADAEQQPVNKGEFMASLRELAGDWGWTVDSVLRFINRLLNAGMIAKTSKSSVYKVRNTERNIMRYNKCNTIRNTKLIEAQEDADASATPSATPSATDTATPSANPHLIIDKKEKDKNKKEKNARATATESAPPALPTETATDGTPLPFGVKRADWDKFAKWSEINLPTLRPRITPVVYWKLRTMSLNDTKQMATILVEMEQGGRKIHVIENEYGRRLREWEENCR